MRQLLRRLQIGGERRKHKSRGQSLVEFALVLPILMLLLLITIDFGRVFAGWVTLNNAARIAANYAGSAQPPLTAAQLTQYQDIVTKETAFLNCNVAGSIPAPTFPNGTTVGGRAVASLTCDFQPITPFISGFFPGGVIKVGATADFPIRAGVIANIVGSGGGTWTAPAQDFSVSPTSVLTNGYVNVTLLTQNGGQGQTWTWNWGDGTTDTVETPPAHQYVSAGTRTITLVETNPGGTSPTYSHTVTVTDPVNNPVANFYGTVPAPCVTAGAPLSMACGGSDGSQIYYTFSPAPTVYFLDMSTNATGATYAWDFGDTASGSSNTSTQQNPSHIYSAAGVFTVKLTVTTAGGSNTLTRTAYVNLGCIVPSFTNVWASNAAALWSGAKFSTSLKYWHSGGTYSTVLPSPDYKIGQQNPVGQTFWVATTSGGVYTCSQPGAVAKQNVTPAP